MLSTTRRRDLPHLPLHPDVRLMALVEARTGHPDFAGDDPRRGQPPRSYPKADHRSSDYRHPGRPDRLRRPVRPGLHVPLPDTELTFIPNSVPTPAVPRSHGRDKIVVPAGRLVQASGTTC